MVVAGFIIAPILGGSWPGFKGPFASGFVLPAYACFPIGYGEISRVMLKTNLIRASTWAPLAIIYAAGLARRLGYSFEYGSAIGFDVVLILMALQPVIVAGHFSSGSNDTRQINWQTIHADALANMPTSHVTPNASDSANRLVPQDESAEVDLRRLGGVQVTSADAAQVYVDKHLIVAEGRHRSALEADAAIGPEHHRCHLGRSGGRSNSRNGWT